ncbi:MAG: hypothetical protein EOR47_25260 [Mesorhizobium sp.]|nr:MAG: hypothetical protein EOR47_25260 [Mesorhizobium sp.]
MSSYKQSLDSEQLAAAFFRPPVADFWISAMDCNAFRGDSGTDHGLCAGRHEGASKFIDALLWMARSGGRCRDLPERLGDCRSVKRYLSLDRVGVLDDMLETWPPQPIWNG